MGRSAVRGNRGGRGEGAARVWDEPERGPAPSEGLVGQEEGQPKACWHLFQHCKLPGSPFCWTTEQKAGEECRLLPVELRAGLPHPRPLLSHLLPSPPHRHRRGWRRGLLCSHKK